MKSNCLFCNDEIVSLNKKRPKKFCSHSCAASYKHLNNGLKTFNVDNWKLRIYKEKIIFCEICGNPETGNSSNFPELKKTPNKLSKDHDHITGNFRGMICSSCNRSLGWFENNREEILRYLESTKDFEDVKKKVDNITCSGLEVKGTRLSRGRSRVQISSAGP